MWSKVLVGRLDAETVEWLSEVAERVLAAERLTVPNDRSGALVSATGISGRADAHVGIVFSILCLEDELGTGPKPTAIARNRLAKIHGWDEQIDPRSGVLLRDALSDEAIDKKLDRAIADVDDPEMHAKLRAIIGRRSR